MNPFMDLAWKAYLWDCADLLEELYTVIMTAVLEFLFQQFSFICKRDI